MAVSGLEMRQNAEYARWSTDRVDKALRGIMQRLHRLVAEEGQANAGPDRAGPDYRRGANLAAYRRLARATVEAGAV